MTIRIHTHVLSSRFSALRQSKSIKQSLLAHHCPLRSTPSYSRLVYCNVVFAGLSNCNIQCLQCIQNIAVRLVTNTSRLASWSSLASYQSAYWIQTVHDCSSLPARWTTTLFGRPHHTSAAATVKAGLRSATTGSVAVPHTTSSLGDLSFTVAVSHAWKNMPSPLRRVHSIDTFRRQHFFAQAFFIFNC